jgi:hypothetical protein
LHGAAVNSDCGTRCRHRIPIQKIRVSAVYADVFFPQHLVLTPPIVFESRLGVHDMLNDCTMTVSDTDFRIPQKGIETKGNAFGSHKYAGKSALWYDLGVDILAGNLVWI